MSNKARILVPALIALILTACGPRGQVEVGPVEFLPTPPLGFIPELYASDTTHVRNGDSFSGLMNRLGLGAEDTYRMVQLCEGGAFDVRRLMAGKEVQAYYGTDGPRRLEYVVYVQDRIRSTVFQCADSLAIWQVEKPVEHQRGFVDVTINSSLWNDMIAAGGSPNLIMTLADIYQWSVNFFALQKKDRFRMIYTESVCEGEVVGIDTVHFCLYDAAAGGKQVAAVRFDTGESDRGTYWDKGGESLKRMFLKAPLKYNRISSGFSYARVHPVTGQVKAHTAVDYAAPTGTPVHALGDGTITKLGWDGGGGGNRIRIKHAQGYETSYMHLSKFASGLKVGSRVSQGQLIGYVGATGTATGPHLDFRVFQNGKAINPLSLNSPASEPLDKKYLEAFNALYDKWMAELNQ
ncbi:MAG: peptidoglycan DD-metalloendopeptidase family protein [Bacteroidales bacterium]|nr:peptidoglycan DD-metalloendopeptidase family protein [Bacteroidales bacterium]